jgi:putative membrane protein
MRNSDFSTPTRQNAVGILVMWTRNIWRSFNILLPAIVIGFGGKNAGIINTLYLTAGIVFVVILMLILSYLQYLKFVFYVEADQFVLEKGVFNKKRLNVPFDRIQSVHLHQNIIQRLLGVTGLEIDTAGSKGKELEISALDRSYAKGLQQFLLDKKEAVLQVALPEGEVPAETSERPLEQERTPIIKLSFIDLLLVGLSQNHIRTGLAAIGIIFGYLQQFRGITEDEMEDYIHDSAIFLSQSGVGIFFTIFFIFVVLSLMTSLILTIFRFYGFEASSGLRGIYIGSGLLARKEYQVPENKIQYLQWKSNPLRKLLGLKTITIRQASSVSSNAVGSVVIPGCTERHLKRFYQRYLPETSDFEPIFTTKPVQFYLIRLFIFFWLLPSIGGWLILWFKYPIILVPVAAYTLLAPIFIYQYFKSISATIFADGFRLTSGWVFPKTIDIKLYKIQNVTLYQTIFMARRHLYSLKAHSASGTITIPYLPREHAYQLFNFFLFKTITSNQKWM